ncbi:MAG: MotA/TolQ/ExbB proton channel family protein [Rhodovarius sp.]|nr:MotA/TolQ/ExbB proton channel family protein [Rhodovarius sp.]MCX7931970.1 MotA/TolQ/ExbB proton channel family protein [Rhodovarius sp.]
MTSPDRYLLRMGAFLAVVLLVAALLAGPLARAFAANPLLNGLILGVMLAGIGWNIRQVLLLRPEVAWVEAFSAMRSGARAPEAPRLLAPMAMMFAARATDRLALSAPAMRGVLDGIASRLDESREISRYATGLLVFLGLLGTFWGLLLTLASVSEVLAATEPGLAAPEALFSRLIAGLSAPLSGMAVAFSSSLLGLAGAIVLGFLDLTAGQAQARFYHELEEWLATRTRLSTAGGAEAEGTAAIADELAEAVALLRELALREAGREERLAAIEAQLARIAEELPQGRAHATAELVAELRRLSQQLALRP